MEKNNPEIFISFSTKDLDKCEKLISKLNSKHCNFWYQEKIGIGEEYKELIKQKIENSIACIFLLSDNFLNSEFIKKTELPWIENKENTALIYEIIPIQIEKCDWEEIELLSGVQIYPSRSSSIDLDNYHDLDVINSHIAQYLDNAGYIKKKGWFR